MIFQDNTANWNSEPVWAYWIYDEQRQVLMISPLLGDIPPPMLKLWCKILNAVDAKEWLSFFEGQQSSLIAYKMIFSPKSIEHLIHQLSPKKIGSLGFLEHEVLGMHIVNSPPPSEWQQRGMKKKLWLQALKLLTE